jgi:LysR family hydrogen peroxide-inducible transcriptional activator
MIDYIYMNFQQLEYILAVSNHRHFARAAESCNVTQATLSAMIKKLEEELGMKIFDRSHQPVITTDEGQDVLELAKTILADQRRLIALSKSEETVFNGELIIGVIPTVANSLLPMVLGEIIKDHPKLKLHIKEITTEEITRQLKEETIDTGILATPLLDDSLEEHVLYYESMMVYGINDRGKKYVLPGDLKNEEIWLLEEGHCFKDQSMTICNIKEKTGGPSNLKFEGNSFDTLLNLSDRFGGYTLVPELYYNLMSNEKKKKTRHFQKPIPVREVSLVHYRPLAKRRVIEALAKEIRKLITPKLTTSAMHAKDLSIIGI